MALAKSYPDTDINPPPAPAMASLVLRPTTTQPFEAEPGWRVLSP
jgi:hypothetical protein